MEVESDYPIDFYNDDDEMNMDSSSQATDYNENPYRKMYSFYRD